MIRGGTNRLGIETGRWRSMKERERVCQVCLCKEVEDEKHFLLRCSRYVSERGRMFARIRQECKLEYLECMDQESQLHVLIGIGWRKEGRKIREIVLEYMRKANVIRKKYVLA